jgi:hypothetical protein
MYSLNFRGAAPRVKQQTPATLPQLGELYR